MIKLEKLPHNIMDRIIDAKKVLAEDKKVIFGYLFGGLAEGKVNPLSDIDIAVYLENTEDIAEYKMHLFGKLSESLGTCEIDLVILNLSPISLTGRILQKKQILIDKNPFKRHVYESTTLRKFFDFKIKEDNYFMRRYSIGR